MQVLIWSIDPATERPDLAFPLQQSGTGIGQVLSILYVVVNSEFGRTIIIDEPQSFLHPGAVRNLFDILRLHPQHQYIVTTHSAIVVSAANPSTLLMVTQQNGESRVESLEKSEETHLRGVLAEIGARLSDVFGAESVLWVEGPTEEASFPLIIQSRDDIPVRATTVVAVHATADFDSKDPKTVVKIYQRLSKGGHLVPPAVGFIFDRERRREEVIKRLQDQLGNRIRFLQRRMYENYLLIPESVAAVVNDIQGFSDKPLDAAHVAEWIEANRWHKDYLGKSVPQEKQRDSTWNREGDGARLLQRLFRELSDRRVEYNKVEHGRALTAWIVRNAPHELSEIGDMLRDLLSSGPAPT